MNMPEHDPLLTPTLTEADDSAGFDRPWNPWSLAAHTFFFGPLGGGCLLALNYRKLGLPGRTTGALVGVVIVGLLMTVGAVWVVAGGMINPSDREARSTLRLVGKVLTVLLGMALASTQQKRWRLFQATGLPQGKLLGPGIVAALLSMLVQFLVALGALRVFGTI